jgi:K+ transporter
MGVRRSIGSCGKTTLMMVSALVGDIVLVGASVFEPEISVISSIDSSTTASIETASIDAT